MGLAVQYWLHYRDGPDRRFQAATEINEATETDRLRLCVLSQLDCHTLLRPCETQHRCGNVLCLLPARCVHLLSSVVYTVRAERCTEASGGGDEVTQKEQAQ